jgi:hypothetical protein
VGLARVGAGGTEAGERVGDEVRPDVGHPAEQDQAELPPRQPSHGRDHATIAPC